MAELRGLILWFTGVPGSGKSFLARAFETTLRRLRVPCVLLDGDVVRASIVPKHGYDSESRDAFYATLGNLALQLASAGHVVLVAATAHLRSFRDRVRRDAGDRLLEIHVDVPRALALQQDSGREASIYGTSVQNVPGQDVGYEPPVRPSLVVRPEDRAQGVPRLLALVAPLLPPDGWGDTVLRPTAQGAYAGIALSPDLAPKQRALCARWGLVPRPELHLTLLYLGEVELRGLVALHAALLGWEGWSELRLRVTGAGAAMNREAPYLVVGEEALLAPPVEPRVAWWSIEGSEGLLALRAHALSFCVREGLPVAQLEQPYFPHVTLGSSAPEGDPFWDQHAHPKEAGVSQESPWELPLQVAHVTSSRMHPESLLPLYFWS